MDNTPLKTNKPNDAFMVRRVLRVQHVRDQDDMENIQNNLSKIDGVRKIEINLQRTRLTISYDAAKTSFGVIEKNLSETGYLPEKSWWSRFKSSWYCYLDENAQTNAKSKGGACCSNPSGIYANRRK